MKRVLIAYAALLCLLAPMRPLWLDELIQLSDTYGHSLAETVVRVAHNPGGVPLAYLAENWIVNHVGHPLRTAHLFSIFCAVFGLASLLWLLRLLGVTGAWWQAALLFAIVPISLRYAIEARQYGPALAFSICATALLAWLDQKPAIPPAVLYAVVLALGIYAQPFVAFTAAAHVVWAWRRPSAKYVYLGVSLAALLFSPWYLYARGFWVQAVNEAGYKSSLNWKTPLQVLRELSGGGYVLTLALIGLAVWGYRKTSLSPGAKRLLLLWILVPLPLILLATALFHYFFAIRQFLFIVPPLCVLASEGLAALPPRPRPAIALALLLIACIYDVRWFSYSREDWSLGAAAAKKWAPSGTCIKVVPESAVDLYRFYESSLPVCSANGGRISVVLVSPYATPEQRATVSNVAYDGPAVEMGGSLVRKTAEAGASR